MQDPRTNLLRNQTREKRRHSPTTTPQRTHSRQTTHLQATGNQFAEHGRGARIDRTEQEPHNGDSDGLADDIRHEPDEQLEGGRAGDEEEGALLLAEAVARVRQQEAAQRDAAPEAGGDVPDARGLAGAVRDEEGDDPAGDGDFGALVGEDEEGAEDGGPVAEGLLEEDGFAGRGAAAGGVRGCGAELLRRAG